MSSAEFEDGLLRRGQVYRSRAETLAAAEALTRA
jgi:hypothetical protein